MSQRIRKPQKGVSPESVIPKLGWYFLILSIPPLFIAPLIPWFARMCYWISKFSLFLALGCFAYWLWLNKVDIKNITDYLVCKKVKNKKVDLQPVLGSRFIDFLIEMDIVVQDPHRLESMYVPTVKQISDGRLRIEAIGNLRKKLVSDSFIWGLESYLNHSGYDVFVQNANYGMDGYVYFTLVRGTRSDRMYF